MRRQRVLAALVAVAAIATAAAAATAPQAGRMTLDTYDLTADRTEGVIGGPLEWSGNVAVSGGGIDIECDRLKVWPAADGRHIVRAEAQGHIVIRGLYVAADKAKWQITGKAEKASYERESAQGTLEGVVSFEAKNAATGAIVSIEADKLVYDVSTRRFRFEGTKKPVRGQWQEPASEKAPADSTEPSSGEAETGS